MESLEFKLAKFFLVLWPLGFFPFAPRTTISLVAAYLEYLTKIYFGSIFTLIFGLITGILGWWTTTIFIEKNKNKDPSEVVIDEFSGQLIASSAAGILSIFIILGL